MGKILWISFLKRLLIYNIACNYGIEWIYRAHAPQCCQKIPPEEIKSTFPFIVTSTQLFYLHSLRGKSTKWARWRKLPRKLSKYFSSNDISEFWHGNCAPTIPPGLSSGLMRILTIIEHLVILFQRNNHRWENICTDFNEYLGILKFSHYNAINSLLIWWLHPTHARVLSEINH